MKEGPWIFLLDGEDDGESKPNYLRGSFSQGKRNGKWEQTDENGNLLVTANYLNDNFHGAVITWKAPAHPVVKKDFFFCEIKSLIRYDELGLNEVLKYELLDKKANGFQFRKTILDGRVVSSHEYWINHIGFLNHEEFEDLLDNATEQKPETAVLNGKAEVKDTEGRRIWSGTYKNNQIIGTWIYTDKEQKVSIEQVYEAGLLTSERYLNLGGMAFTGLYTYRAFDLRVIELRTIKNGLRHGKTTYIDAATNKILRKETYKKGKLKT